jgi:predicted GNAT family acetyltransferase
LITREANLNDLNALSNLALRSKAYWDYNSSFIESCREDLTITPERLDKGNIQVALGSSGETLGFYSFLDEDEPAMDFLFIEPELIGKGIGKKLWLDALRYAEAKGWSSFSICADPFASENFYLKVGCEQIGEIESSVSKGRMLPLLRYRLRE